MLVSITAAKRGWVHVRMTEKAGRGKEYHVLLASVPGRYKGHGYGWGTARAFKPQHAIGTLGW